MTDFDKDLASRPTDPREQAGARARFRRLLIGETSIGGLAVRAGIAIETAYLNSSTGLAWPSLATLAEDIGCKRRAAISAIDELVRSGLILKRAGGGNAANTYTLPWRRLVHDGAPVHEDAPVSNDAPVSDDAPEGCTTVHGGGVEPCTGVVSNGAPELLERTGRTEPVDEPVECARPIAPLSANDDGGKSARSPKATRIDPSWQPSEDDRAFARQQGLSDRETDREADQFRDYWIAKAGKDAAKLDWPATWRSWVRIAIDRHQRVNVGSKDQRPSGVAATKEVFDQIRLGFEDGGR
ncbi:helix-turn-helix domain-containing protein [Thalassobaculum sp.]|uniref:helix-turn-helix domain-containing protein n=1 Tax=Thalassobaculum sp. TaxID=2022740 RepID=UPI003B59B38F